MVADGSNESKSLVEAERMLGSVAPGASNAEDSLPSPEIHLHIAIEVIYLLWMA
jgi:hypothetical protein